MPFKFEYTKKLIPKELKRNYKLSDKDKQDIKKLYYNGLSSRKIGGLYNVNHSNILYIVNPKIKERQRLYLKENFKKFPCSSKENQNIYSTKYRRNKHLLDLENKLI